MCVSLIPGLVHDCHPTRAVTVDSVTWLAIETLWCDHPVVEPGFVVLAHGCFLAENLIEMSFKRQAMMIRTVIPVHGDNVFGCLVVLTTKFLWFCHVCMGCDVGT